MGRVPPFPSMPSGFVHQAGFFLRGFLLFLITSNLSPAQQPAAPQRARELRDVAYVEGGHQRQKLDLYFPAGGGDRRPLLVWIHGGGWQGGSKEQCPALGMLAQGFVVASLNYRLSQHAVFPAQLEDCKAAIRWLRAHAGENGIDPDRIGIWGASAGGHLAALLGVTGHTRQFDVGGNLNESSRVQCVLDWFGPSDFLHWGDLDATRPARGDGPASPIYKLLGGSVHDHPDAARLASPLYFIQKDAAPFLIMHGDHDSLVPLQQSVDLDKALKAAGVKCRLDVIAGADHGGSGFTTPEKLRMMGGFFQTHLAVPRGNAR